LAAVEVAAPITHLLEMVLLVGLAVEALPALLTEPAVPVHPDKVLLVEHLRRMAQLMELVVVEAGQVQLAQMLRLVVARLALVALALHLLLQVLL
jgi:hypothetical protein